MAMQFGKAVHVITVSSASEAEHFAIHSQSGSPTGRDAKGPKPQRRRSQPVESTRSSSARSARPEQRKAGLPADRKSKSTPLGERGRKPSPNRPTEAAAAKVAAVTSRAPQGAAKASPRATSRRSSEPPPQSKQARSEPSPGTKSRGSTLQETKDLQTENEKLRLQVQALKENQQWATDMHWEVIAKVIQERDKMEDRCQRLYERATAAEEELSKLQGSIAAPAPPVVAPVNSASTDGSVSVRPPPRFCYTPMRRLATVVAPAPSVRRAATPLRIADDSTSVLVPNPGAVGLVTPVPTAGEVVPSLASKLGWQNLQSGCVVAPQAVRHISACRTHAPAAGVVIRTVETAGSTWGTGSVALAPRMATAAKVEADSTDAPRAVVPSTVKEDVMDATHAVAVGSLPTPCRAGASLNRGVCRASSVPSPREAVAAQRS